MFLGWLKVFVFQSSMYTEDQIPLKFISELLMRKLEQTERKKKAASRWIERLIASQIGAPSA